VVWAQHWRGTLPPLQATTPPGANIKHLLLALALLLIPATCCAEVLASEVISGGSRMTGLDHRVRPFIGYDVGTPNPRLLFDDTWLDSTNVGTVLVATAATDTDFASVVARLTNGVSDVLCWGTCETVPISCAARYASEAAFFQMATPDFGPVTIERVTLELNEMYFRLDPVFQNPAVHWTFTITVEGYSTTPVRAPSWGSVKVIYR
jgi:hypothetical protein